MIVTEVSNESLGYSYKGNPKIRPIGINLDFTAEQTDELIKCMQSCEYFCDNYLKIVTLDHGLQPFKLRPYQTECVHKIVDNRFVLVKQSRQSGKTTLVAATLLWYALFNPTYSIGVLAHKQSQAVEILDRVKTYFQNLPYWLQHGVIEWNKLTVVLENGSTIFAAASSINAVAGRTISILYLDEFDLLHVNMQEDLYNTTFPTISSGSFSKFIISTTPRGYKKFYKLWKDSEEGKSDFVRHEINWWDVPGRDEAWKAKEIARMGGSDLKFRQEYATEFIGSSNTLIDGTKIGLLTYEEAVITDAQNHLQIFEKPIHGHKYVMSVDVSEGVEGDYSTFVVVDVSAVPYKVVATYANNMITPMMFPNIIIDVATFFNHAYVLVETNAIGQQVVNILYYDLEYEYILSTNVKSKKGDVTEGIRSQLGIKQNKRTKQVGTSNLKALIENDQLLVTDYRIIYGISRFVRKGSSWAAEEGDHDDLIMAMVIFAWLTSQDTFKDISNTDARLSLNERINTQEDMPDAIYNTNTPQDSMTNFAVMSDFDRWMIN